MPLFNAFILRNLREYRHKLYIAKNYILWATSFVSRQWGLTSTTVTSLTPKATEFHEITQNNGQYVVQGHLRSPIILVSMEIQYMWLPICEQW